MHPDAHAAIAQALHDATLGVTVRFAKAHGEDRRLAGVMKIVKDASDGNTYRGVYTAEFKEAIWVIDLYEKKSTSGISTPKPDINRTVGRLKSLRLYRTTPAGKEEIADLLSDLERRTNEMTRKEAQHVGRGRKPKGS